MLACAKIFMASAATALNRLGVVMVPRATHRDGLSAARHPADRSPQLLAASQESATTSALGRPARRRAETEPIARAGPGGPSIMVAE